MGQFEVGRTFMPDNLRCMSGVNPGLQKQSAIEQNQTDPPFVGLYLIFGLMPSILGG